MSKIKCQHNCNRNNRYSVEVVSIKYLPLKVQSFNHICSADKKVTKTLLFSVVVSATKDDEDSSRKYGSRKNEIENCRKRSQSQLSHCLFVSCLTFLFSVCELSYLFVNCHIVCVSYITSISLLIATLPVCCLTFLFFCQLSNICLFLSCQKFVLFDVKVKYLSVCELSNIYP